MGGRSRRGVTVCVVTHDCEADIAPFLAAIDALDPAPAEIVAVDSGSRDGTVDALAAAAVECPLRIEPVAENIGFARGMNRAIEGTSTPWILALNADTRPAPDLLARLIACARATSRPVGAVTGRLTRLETPDRLDACGMYLTWPWRHHDRGSGARDRGQWMERQRVFGATGAAVLLRRAALDDVAIDGEHLAGEFHSYREDAELAFRLQERGWEVLYEPTAAVAHRRTGTPKRRRRMPAHVNYHSLKNRYLLRAYHQGGLNFLLTLAPTLVRDLAALAYALVVERRSLPAYGWLWAHRREILAKRRRIRARRTRSQRRVDRWFLTRGLPL